MKIKYLLMAAFVLPCALFTACGGDDGEDTGKTSIDNGEEEKTTIAKVDIPVDDTFKPDASYIQVVWAGEYKGWDEVQKKNTTIRRQLTLNPNGTYTNKIAGQLVASGKGFYPFESEGGKYTYDQAKGVITYTCEYDSVLNYRDQSYTKYTQKHYYDHQQATYTENVKFSTQQKGKRVWITKDTYLQSLTAEVLDLVFSMSEYAGDNQQDQNK